MSKYLRREKARACPIHIAIADKAAEQLTEVGAFEKDEVLDALNFNAVADSIRWDYVREWIEEDYDCELIPLVHRFFHSTREERTNGWTPPTHPEKYIASGHGKKTAGYAAVGFDRKLDRVCIHRLMQKKGIANGAGKALLKYVEEVQKRGLALPPELKAIASGDKA